MPFLLFCRYYRANSVRYATQPCEGICALNHYCAITRVDYREFRVCLESATGALSSSSPASGSTIFRFTLLLSVFTAFSKSQQRKLLLDWLQCLFHANMMAGRSLIKILGHSVVFLVHSVARMCLPLMNRPMYFNDLIDRRRPSRRRRHGGWNRMLVLCVSSVLIKLINCFETVRNYWMELSCCGDGGCCGGGGGLRGTKNAKQHRHSVMLQTQRFGRMLCTLIVSVLCYKPRSSSPLGTTSTTTKTTTTEPTINVCQSKLIIVGRRSHISHKSTGSTSVSAAW